jgi:Family of unknown function (DUF5989)
MAPESESAIDRHRTTFEKAAEKRPSTFLGEFWRFLRENRKWWLVPIILTLLLVAVLVVAASSGAGPLMYTLF